MKSIYKYLDADVPFILWGAPGTGKTAHLSKMAEERNVHMEVLIGSTMDPTDLGRPIVTSTDDVKILPPPWAERIHKALERGQETWLFLDELTCSPPSIQAAFLRVVNERRICDYDISGCKIIAAANPSEQAADGNDLSAAMSNRWAHIDWIVDPEDWVVGELSGWGNPDKEMADARALICSWIEHNTTALLQPPEYGEEKNAWPSPRTWSMFARLLKGEDIKKYLNDKDGRQMATSIVGQSAAAEFLSWLVNQDIPKPLDLINGKKKFPTRGDQIALCVSSVISYCVSNPKKIDKLWPLFLSIKKREDITALATIKAFKALKKGNIDYDITEECEKCMKITGKLK